MKQDGRIGCGCLIFILVCVLVGVGLTAHPISLRLLGNQFRYEDKISPAEAIFVPRFEEDRNGEVYVDAFREYWGSNGKVIYIEEDKILGASILDPVQKMAHARGIKEGLVKKIEADGDETEKALKIRKQFAAAGIRKVIVLVPEYASRRFHMLYGKSGHEGRTVFLIKPVTVSYFKRDAWWKNGSSRMLVLNELVDMGSLTAEKFRGGKGGD